MKQLKCNYVTFSTVTWLQMLCLQLGVISCDPISPPPLSLSSSSSLPQVTQISSSPLVQLLHQKPQRTGSCFCNASAEVRLFNLGFSGASFSCIEFESVAKLDFNLVNIGSSDQCSRSEPIELILNKNVIPILNSTFFHKFIRIVQLDLRENLVEHITSNTFSNLINLRFLDLSDNRIKQIDSQLDHLFLLNRLNLSNNRISWIENNAFHNLVNLTSLDLSNNELVVIKSHTLTGLTSLSNLNLGSNRLQVIEKGAFKDFLNKIRKIRLQNNQLVCDCNLKWLVDLVQEWNRNLIGKLFCTSPPELNRIRLNSINSHDLTCDHDLLLERLQLHFYPQSVLTEGEQFQLSCQAIDVKQLTTIRILKEDQLLADGTNLFPRELHRRAQVDVYRPTRPAWTGNELHSNLTVRNIGWQDSGQYQCVVITPYGKAVRSISIQVHRKTHSEDGNRWRWVLPFLVVLPLLISSLVYISQYALIEMPTRIKHLLINTWIRLAFLQLFIQLHPLWLSSTTPAADHNVESAKESFHSSIVNICSSFFIHYALNSCQLWQVFHVFALYQLVTSSTAKPTLSGHNKSSLLSPADQCRPFIFYYAISFVFCSLAGLLQTYASGVDTVFGFLTSSTTQVVNKISAPFMWTIPPFLLVVQLTISVLIVVLLKQFHSSKHHQFTSSTTNSPRPDQNSPTSLWKPASLLSDSNDLYWSFGKQLRVHWIEMALTMTMVVVACLCSTPVEKSSIPDISRQSSAVQDQQKEFPTDPVQTIYDRLREKSDLNAEQMQNLQNWLSQLQKTHQKSQNRFEPLIKLPEKKPFLNASDRNRSETSALLSALMNFLNENAFKLSCLLLNFFVLIRFVLLREDVRVALMSGTCGFWLTCNGTSALFGKGGGHSAGVNTLQRAKVKAMREQLRRTAALEAEKSDRPLLPGHHMPRLLSALDSGQFSSQPSCTITQSLSSSSGHGGLVGSARGTLCRSTIDRSCGTGVGSGGGVVVNGSNCFQQHPVTVEMLQQPHYLNQEQLRLNKNIHYEKVEVNPNSNDPLIRQEREFWNLLQNGECQNRDAGRQSANANSSSRVHLLGSINGTQHPPIGQAANHFIVNRQFSSIMGNANVAALRVNGQHRAFDDSFLEGDGSYLLTSTSKAQSDILPPPRNSSRQRPIVGRATKAMLESRIQFVQQRAAVQSVPVKSTLQQVARPAPAPAIAYATDFERAYAQRRTQCRQIPLEYVPPTRSSTAHAYAQSEFRNQPNEAMSCISTRSQPPPMALQRKPKVVASKLTSPSRQVHYTDELVFGPPLGTNSRNNRHVDRKAQVNACFRNENRSDGRQSGEPVGDDFERNWPISIKPLLICGPNLIASEPPQKGGEMSKNERMESIQEVDRTKSKPHTRLAGEKTIEFLNQVAHRVIGRGGDCGGNEDKRDETGLESDSSDDDFNDSDATKRSKREENIYERIESMLLLDDADNLQKAPITNGQDTNQKPVEEGCEKSNSIAFVRRDALGCVYAKGRTQAPVDGGMPKKGSKMLSKHRRKKRKGLDSTPSPFLTRMSNQQLSDESSTE